MFYSALETYFIFIKFLKFFGFSELLLIGGVLLLAVLRLGLLLLIIHVDSTEFESGL
jgi:hypothetical protein